MTNFGVQLVQFEDVDATSLQIGSPTRHVVPQMGEQQNRVAGGVLGSNDCNVGIDIQFF